MVVGLPTEGEQNGGREVDNTVAPPKPLNQVGYSNSDIPVKSSI